MPSIMPRGLSESSPLENELDVSKNSDNTLIEYERIDGMKYLYGTAGFRLKANIMGPVAYRMGLMAAALSTHYDGQVVGVMLTASHNPLADNGVKIVAPNGESLPSCWESLAELLAHTPMGDLENVITRNIGVIGEKGRVAIGRDTRPSGIELTNAVRKGAEKLGVQVTDLGEVTTPQFHSFILHLNKSKHTLNSQMLEDHYFDSLKAAFIPILNTFKINLQKVQLFVDAANGVGSEKTKRLAKILSHLGYEIKVINDGSKLDDILNYECGADHVKVTQSAPRMRTEDKVYNLHYASLDGDADRLVYFTFDEEINFHLLDGDRIAALCALTIQKLLGEAGLDHQISYGLVHTAYANGAFLEFISQTLKIPTICTSTGVKYLHKEAHTFGIGIYFEANGHGTVLFSESALDTIRSVHNDAAFTLLSIARLANQLVGDALADMLLVEAMLVINGMDLSQWCSLYTDLPSALLKISVKDRTRIKTERADQIIVEPCGLQAEINAIVEKYPKGRSFARASGTEDVVRIFAESTTPDNAANLAAEISQLLGKLCL